MNPQPQVTSQQLVQALVARGVTIKQLAAECDRDPSLLYQVAAGKRPGTNLLPTLASIARTGYANQRPPRRTTKSGQPVRLRAAAGSPPRIPPAPSPTAPRPGRFSVQTTFLAGGARTRRITAPKSSRPGRFDANQATLDAIAEAAREQRKVAFVVHYADGSSRTLGAKGGYRGDAAFIRTLGEGGDAFQWLSQEVEGAAARLYDLRGIGEPIVGVDVTIFGQPNPQQPVPRQARARSTPAPKRRTTPSRKAPRMRATAGGSQPPPGAGQPGPDSP